MCEEAEATTINECNEREDVKTTEAPSRKMPVVNQVAPNRNMNNSKLTNESRIKETTQADFSSMQRAGVRNTSHYSAIGLANQPAANNSIFSFSGSEHNKTNSAKPGDFPYLSTGSMM